MTVISVSYATVENAARASHLAQRQDAILQRLPALETRFSPTEGSSNTAVPAGHASSMSEMSIEVTSTMFQVLDMLARNSRDQSRASPPRMLHHCVTWQPMMLRCTASDHGERNGGRASGDPGSQGVCWVGTSAGETCCGIE